MKKEYNLIDLKLSPSEIGAIVSAMEKVYSADSPERTMISDKLIKEVVGHFIDTRKMYHRELIEKWFSDWNIEN